MKQPEETPRQTPPDAGKAWERPTVTFVGTVGALVRAGNAFGKVSGISDGDADNPRHTSNG
jgi:hypothetical protein